MITETDIHEFCSAVGLVCEIKYWTQPEECLAHIFFPSPHGVSAILAAVPINRVGAVYSVHGNDISNQWLASAGCVYSCRDLVGPLLLSIEICTSRMPKTIHLAVIKELLRAYKDGTRGGS